MSVHPWWPASESSPRHTLDIYDEARTEIINGLRNDRMVLSWVSDILRNSAGDVREADTARLVREVLDLYFGDSDTV